MPRGLFIPAGFDVKQATEDLARIKSEAKKAGEQMASEFLKGSKSAKEFIADLRKIQQQTVAAAKEAQSRGLLDKNQFRDIKREADRAFNASILPALRQMRQEGKQNTEEFVRLQKALRNVAASGGRDIRDGAKSALSDLPGFVRGALATGILGGFLFIAREVTRIFTSMVNGIRATFERGGLVQAAEQSFEALTTSRGLSAVKTIEELRKGAAGLVNDLDLMKQANFALLSGLPATEESLGRLVEVSRRLARASGRDATEAFQRLVQGIAKGEQQILEELGLLTRLEDVLKKYTRETGKSSDALTQGQKILLFYNAVLADAEAKVAALGEELPTANERLQQMATFMDNLKSATAEAIVEVPKIAEFLERLGVGAKDSAEKIQDLADTIQALLTVILDSPGAEVFAKLLGLELKVGAAIGRGVLGIDSDDVDREKARIRAVRELAQAQQQFAALQTRLDNLRNPPPGTTEVDEEALKAAKKAAEERERLAERIADLVARLTLDQVQNELRGLEEIREAYRKTGKEIEGDLKDRFDLARDLTLRQGDIRDVQEDLAALLALEPSPEVLSGLDAIEMRILNLKRAVSDSIPLTEQLDKMLEQLAKQREKIEAQAITQDVREPLEARQRELRELFAAGVIDEEVFKDQGDKAGEAFNKALLARIAMLRKEGKNELADALSDLLVTTPTEEQKQEKRIRAIREQGRAIEEGARRVADLARQFGILDEKAAAALESIAQIGANIQLAMQGDIGAIFNVIAGAGQVLAQVTGNTAEDRARRDVLRQNTLALERLRQGIADLTGLLGIAGGDIAGAGRAAQRSLQLIPETAPQADRVRMRLFQHELSRLGITMEEAKRIASDFGIELDGSRESLEAFSQAVAQLELDQLFNSFTGQMDLLQAEFDTFDIEDPIEQLERMRGVFLDFIDLPAELEARIAGINLGTEAGRREFERVMQDIFRQLQSGELTAEQLGGLSVQDLLAFIRESLGLLEGASESEGTTSGIHVSRSITEASASVLIGINATILFHSERMHTLQATYFPQILAALGGRPVGTLVPIPGSAQSATSSGQQFSFGDINLTVQGAQLPAVTDEISGKAFGRVIMSGVMEAAQEMTDHAVGERTVNFRRAKGTLRG